MPDGERRGQQRQALDGGQRAGASSGGGQGGHADEQQVVRASRKCSKLTHSIAGKVTRAPLTTGLAALLESGRAELFGPAGEEQPYLRHNFS